MNSSIRTRIGICTLAIGIFMGTNVAPVYAKDACVEDDFGVLYVFKKVKPLKKPGAVTALNGAILFGGVVSTVSGTAYVRSDAVVEFGVYVHSSSPTGGLSRDYVITLEGGADYQASGYYDLDGDHVAEVPLSWTPVDCKTVTLP